MIETDINKNNELEKGSPKFSRYATMTSDPQPEYRNNSLLVIKLAMQISSLLTQV